MNMKMIAGACLCAAAIVGCVSVEQTRQQLQSKDPEQVKLAEENIIKVVSYQALSADMPEKYVELAESNELLGKIISCSQDQKVVLAAICKLDPSKSGTPNELLLQMMEQSRDDKMCKLLASKLDFNQSGLATAILTKHKNVMENVSRVEQQSGVMSAHDAKAATAKNTRVGTFVDKVFSKLSEQELKDVLDGDLDYQLKKTAALRLLEVTEDPGVLKDMLDGNLSNVVGDYGREKAVLKLSSMADKINDEKIVIAVLNGIDNHSLRNYVQNPSERKALLSRLSEEKMVECVSHWFGVNMRSYNRSIVLSDAAAVASLAKDPKNIARFASEVYSWINDEGEDSESLRSQLPKLSDEVMFIMLGDNSAGWKNYIDIVSPELAYKVLVSKKAKTPELELELLKKVPSDMLDVSVYNGARADGLKKAIYAKMSPAQQKQVQEANEKAFAGVIEKAKSASKETFALEGFYLGMSWEDMKIVLAHHFPELEATEKDDDGLELYVSNQKSAFCFADKEKKIYQFNFGKKMLKKWYKYDVQDYAQWASAYSHEHKIDMQYKMVEKEATVHEPMDMSRSYRVWFYQHSYQYKHNAKEYRLTYFGEEKDFACEGGIGGAVIKELAAPKFRYTRGDPGSLRVRIEKD